MTHFEKKMLFFSTRPDEHYVDESADVLFLAAPANLYTYQQHGGGSPRVRV